MGEFFIKNSLLRVLGASAVQSPNPASQECLKTQNKRPYETYDDAVLLLAKR
jgi:hypothetical protein